MKQIVIILAVLFIGTIQSIACDCKEVKSIEEEYAFSKAVVTGKIISKEQVVLTDSKIVEYNPSSKPYNGRLIVKYQLVLVESIKGNFKTDTIDIYTGMGGPDCGVNFDIGKEYLVYGIEGIDNEKTFTVEGLSLWTINCLRTKLSDNSEVEKLKQLIKE